MTLGGQVQIDQGGIEAAVAEVLLNAAEINTGFQKMRGIGMANVWMETFLRMLSCVNTRRNAPWTEVLLMG